MSNTTSLSRGAYPGGAKVYRALLSQTGGAVAPVATILTNTLGGNPVWSYVSAGRYRVTMNNMFPSGKTTVSMPHTVNVSIESDAPNPKCFLNSPNYIEVFAETGNGQFKDSPIEIIVYP